MPVPSSKLACVVVLRSKPTIRDKMMRILIFLIIGRFAVKGAPSIYQAEEDDNIIFSLDSDIQIDLSFTNMICYFESEKTFYHMIRGAEDLDSQHERFAGRVQCDRDALRGGRIKLHLLRVRAEDSGNYRCDLAGNYDHSLKRWEFETSEQFVLHVTQKTQRTNGDGQTTTSEKYQPVGSKHQQPVCPNPSKVGPILAMVALVLLIVNIRYPLLQAVFRFFGFVHRHLSHQAQH